MVTILNLRVQYCTQCTVYFCWCDLFFISPRVIVHLKYATLDYAMFVFVFLPKNIHFRKNMKNKDFYYLRLPNLIKNLRKMWRKEQNFAYRGHPTLAKCWQHIFVQTIICNLARQTFFAQRQFDNRTMMRQRVFWGFSRNVQDAYVHCVHCTVGCVCVVPYKYVLHFVSLSLARTWMWRRRGTGSGESGA